MKMAQVTASALVLLCLVSANVASAEKVSFAKRQNLAADPSPEEKAVKSEKEEPVAAPPPEDKDRVAGPIPSKVVDWSQGSALDEGVQFLCASLWIGLLGSIPLALRFVSTKPVTKTEIGLSCVLWVCLFGGLWLFTNIILFQSPHFGTEIRPLTMVECIYLMSQVITTVGYGDITPAKPRGQVFVGLYVLGALFVISMLVSQLMAHMGKVAQEYEKKLLEQSQAADEALHRSRSESSLAHLHFIAGKPPPPDRKPLYRAMAIFAVVDLIFVTFFYTWPGEHKTFLECFYMSVITLSTVGFGAFTPLTEGGMIFDAFMMLFGSAALVNVIGNFGDLMVRQQKYEQFDPKACEHALERLEEKIKGTKVSELEFLQFALVSQGLVAEEEFDKISAAFKHLNPKSGAIQISDIASCINQSLKEP
eukprot:TRINITY_DN4573_c1_g3_i1.p1 TRINITY_DN4573_c1_g3~~TRINITY_DN4573_c1_g3_i1.p1  ORF type:complete len:421 (+),score=92.57 TRINITY_DN4573_c1_g3_i1:145-1407(+)